MKRRARSKVHARFSPFQFVGSGQASIIFMLAATLLAIFMVPVLFVAVERIVDKLARRTTVSHEANS